MVEEFFSLIIMSALASGRLAIVPAGIPIPYEEFVFNQKKTKLPTHLRYCNSNANLTQDQSTSSMGHFFFFFP